MDRLTHIRRFGATEIYIFGAGALIQPQPSPCHSAREGEQLRGSLFFPTFRRIEGGFSLTTRRASARNLRARNELEDAMLDLSKRMSQKNHTFVASISTTDIVSLLMRKYTDMSELSNELQKDTSQGIIAKIKEYKRDAKIEGGDGAAEAVLDRIRSMIESMETRRDDILSPLKAVTDLT